MHFGRADPYDWTKCVQLESVIFVSGGLRSRYPLIKKINVITVNILDNFNQAIRFCPWLLTNISHTKSSLDEELVCEELVDEELVCEELVREELVDEGIVRDNLNS